jgi:putative transposase
VRPVRRKAVLPQVRSSWQVSERRACAVLDVNRETLRYRSKRIDDSGLRARIKEIATVRVRYGYRRITVLLRREGWCVNHKHVHRIYREEGLAIRTKRPRRRRMAIVRVAALKPTAPNQSWAMDFMHDVLADGTKVRLLTVVDNFSRENLALEVDHGFRAAQVVEVLRRIVAERAKPLRIHCDNGPEFVSLQLDQWAYWNGVQLDFSRPGHPSDNAVCESFNNRVRQELLNPNWFRSLHDLKVQAAAWRHDYNANHPHSSLGNLTPDEFARKVADGELEAAFSGEVAE